MALGAEAVELPHDDPMDNLVFDVSKATWGGPRHFSNFADATVTVEELREGQRTLVRKLRADESMRSGGVGVERLTAGSLRGRKCVETAGS